MKLHRYELSDINSYDKHILYVDNIPRLKLTTEISGIMCAVTLSNTKHCNVVGVIEEYDHRLKKVADIYYNIAKDRVMIPDNDTLISYDRIRADKGDKVLFLFLRDKYPQYCWYNPKFILPVIRKVIDSFEIFF